LKNFDKIATDQVVKNALANFKKEMAKEKTL